MPKRPAASSNAQRREEKGREENSQKRRKSNRMATHVHAHEGLRLRFCALQAQLSWASLHAVVETGAGLAHTAAQCSAMECSGVSVCRSAAVTLRAELRSELINECGICRHWRNVILAQSNHKFIAAECKSHGGRRCLLCAWP